MSQVIEASRPAPVETDGGFFAARRLVKQTGSYPRDRAIEVAKLSGALGLGLFGAIVVTALVGMASKAVAALIFLAGVIAFAFLGMPYVERRFFAMRCAFAFLVTEVLMGRAASIPATGTTAAATEYLNQRLGDTKAVYEAHRRVRNLVSRFFRTFDRLDALLPIDLGPVRRAMTWAVDKVAPRIADIAVSFAVARGERDIEAAGKDAVALVAQNPKAVLGAAVRAEITERFLGGIVGTFALVIFVSLFGALAGALATNAASDGGIATEGAQTMGIFAAIFGGLLFGAPVAWLCSWFVRTAFLEPATLTMILVRFQAATHGQAVDPAIRARLDSANSDIRKANNLMGMFD